MSLCNDYAHKIPGSVPYQLRQEQTSMVLQVLLFVAALIVHSSGVVWRLSESAVRWLWTLKHRNTLEPKSTGMQVGIRIRKSLLPLLFFVCGYMSYLNYGMFGAYVYLLSLLVVWALAKAFASGFAEGMQDKSQ